MVKALAIGAMLVLGSCLLGEAAAGQIDLVKDGRAVATIVKPSSAPKWTNKAAEWLREYVDKVSGAALEVVTEEEAPSGTLISVGHTKLAAKAGIDDSGLRWDDCRLVIKGDVLYLLGRDDAGTKTRDYVGARGTCRAVIKLLEDFCGVRWFLPGPQGELIVPAKDVQVPGDLDVVSRTVCAYSTGRSVYDANILDEPGKSIAAQANNYRLAVKAAPGGETYYASVPQQEHGKTHPEYYALIGGKRRNAEWTKESPYGHHLCSRFQ